VESLGKHGLLKYVWAPQFEKGDILAFTNFTMHATHCLPTMTLPRASVEVRVNLLNRTNLLDDARVNLPRSRSILDHLRASRRGGKRKRYLNIELLKDQQMRGAITA
jgi:hypothetical protein